MKTRIMTALISGMICLTALMTTSCDDDCESYYYSYGIVNSGNTKQLAVKTDKGNQVYVKETYIPVPELKDSTRVYLQYSILSEQDSTAYVKLAYVDTILTKPILDYDKSILDSLGNDPVKITHAWTAHGFINLEFAYAASAYPSTAKRHMVNLLRCPADGKDGMSFEFRHNNNGDMKSRIAVGTVSFRMDPEMASMPRPYEFEIRYRDEDGKEAIKKVICK